LNTSGAPTNKFLSALDTHSQTVAKAKEAATK
jgi:hypothetical protein